MGSINSIILEGHMIKKPIFKLTNNGTPICVFTIANNRFFMVKRTMRQETSFFDVETWAELADRCAMYGEKGVPVRIVGRIKQYRWKSANGCSCAAIRLVAEHVEFRRKSDLENEIDDLVEEENPNEFAIREKEMYTKEAIKA